MGTEYIVRLDSVDAPVGIQRLEELLCVLPNYYGIVPYPDNMAFEFWAPENKDTSTMPSLYVIARGHDIVVCQNGDALILAQVLGAIVAEFTAGAKNERVEVLMA